MAYLEFIMTLIDIRYVHERTRNIFIPWGGGGGVGGVGGGGERLTPSKTLKSFIIHE